MDGILNVLKPVGMTSFDVVALVRRWTGVRRVGHTGTLDPDAAGVLTVCVGRATRAVDALTDKDKSYRAELRLGIVTDTQDAGGQVVAQAEPVDGVDRIIAVMRGMVGQQMQVPPMYSAIKVDGRRLYQLAREGFMVERNARAVLITQCDLISFHRKDRDVRVLMDVTCSKGTYIRTLCHDIGMQLGCGGHMSFLLRTRTGPFALSQAHSLEQLADAAASGTMETLLLPVDAAFANLPVWKCGAATAGRLLNGQTVRLDSEEACPLPGVEKFRVYAGERFLGLGMRTELLPLQGQTSQDVEIGIRLYRQLGGQG